MQGNRVRELPSPVKNRRTANRSSIGSNTMIAAGQLMMQPVPTAQLQFSIPTATQPRQPVDEAFHFGSPQKHMRQATQLSGSKFDVLTMESTPDRVDCLMSKIVCNTSSDSSARSHLRGKPSDSFEESPFEYDNVEQFMSSQDEEPVSSFELVSKPQIKPATTKKVAELEFEAIFSKTLVLRQKQSLLPQQSQLICEVNTAFQ